MLPLKKTGVDRTDSGVPLMGENGEEDHESIFKASLTNIKDTKDCICPRFFLVDDDNFNHLTI